MPHGGGGGSHSGGSHSSHSSHSSSHGGSHSGGGRSSVPHISHRPFRGCRRYMYYDRLGSQRYVYSTRMPRPQSLATMVFLLIFMIPFITSGVFVTRLAIKQFMPPKSLTPVYAQTREYILDKDHVIDNQPALEQTLQKFEDKTGICPYIMTVYDSDWKGKYNTLENYAYSLYVNAFDDEQHFLVVYSEPENAAELDFVDWSYEGMLGNDTDPILTDEKYQHFQNDLQKYLTVDSISTGEAMNRAFSNSLDYMMKNNTQKEAGLMLVFFSVVWNLVIWLLVITQIRNYIIGKREYTEMPMYDGVNDGIQM